MTKIVKQKLTRVNRLNNITKKAAQYTNINSTTNSKAKI